MGVLFFILFGFVVGLIARAVFPGRQNMGFVMTALLGMAGSFIGGAIGSAIVHRGVAEFHTAGIIGSIIGALVVLAVGAMIGGRRGVA